MVAKSVVIFFLSLFILLSLSQGKGERHGDQCQAKDEFLRFCGNELGFGSSLFPIRARPYCCQKVRNIQDHCLVGLSKRERLFINGVTKICDNPWINVPPLPPPVSPPIEPPAQPPSPPPSINSHKICQSVTQLLDTCGGSEIDAPGDARTYCCLQVRKITKHCYVSNLDPMERKLLLVAKNICDNRHAPLPPPPRPVIPPSPSPSPITPTPIPSPDVPTPSPDAPTPTPSPDAPTPIVPSPSPSPNPLPPSPSPSPDAPTPSPDVPTPTPDVPPKPSPTPSPDCPTPIPSPDVPTPIPSPTPSPDVPTPVPSPTPSPSPSPNPFIPTPAPSPSPDVPTPAPSPDVPTPVPTPSPSPDVPTPAPSPDVPTPVPTPSPSPNVPTPAPSPDVPTPVPVPSPSPFIPTPTPSPSPSPNVPTPSPPPSPFIPTPAPSPNVPTPVPTPSHRTRPATCSIDTVLYDSCNPRKPYISNARNASEEEKEFIPSTTSTGIMTDEAGCCIGFAIFTNDCKPAIKDLSYAKRNIYNSLETSCTFAH